jgi:glycosyltransferase involved in cell wall biosynthesis
MVIAVSRFTARQVDELLGYPKNQIRVVPHGVHSPHPAPSIEREPVILFTGALQARKNLIRLVQAFEQLPGSWRLVLVGSAGYGAAAILDRISTSSARERIEVKGWVDDSALQGWLARASIFAFPSLDEGFGIPVLEAMAWGVPVVTSSSSALPEIAQGAALLVDPNDVDGLARALRHLIENASERARLREAGLARAHEYPWTRAVEETWRVYLNAGSGEIP